METGEAKSLRDPSCDLFGLFKSKGMSSVKDLNESVSDAESRNQNQRGERRSRWRRGQRNILSIIIPT